MKKSLLISLLILCGCTTPCYRDTYDFRKDIASVKKEHLSKQEILDRYGEPDKKDTTNGKEVWIYWAQQIRTLDFPFYTHYRDTKIADTYYRIWFDEKGIMEKMTSSSIGYNGNYPKVQVRL